MPLLTLASDVRISIPLSPVELPFSLWIDNTDVVGSVDKSSYRLDDTALTQPGIFTFTITDVDNSIGPLIRRLALVTWNDNATDTIMYRGFVRQIDFTPFATYGLWTLTCTDVSELYDYGQPLLYLPEPAQTTKERIVNILDHMGLVAIGGATGEYIQSLSGVVQDPIVFSKETGRSAIEKAL